MSTVAIAVVCAWLGLCAVANVLPRSSRALGRWRLFAPEWRLFAPEPPKADFHLCSRTRSEHAEAGPLERVLAPSYTWSRVLWNPDGRRRSMVQGLIGALLEELGPAGPARPAPPPGMYGVHQLPERLAGSEPYLLLLGLCGAGRSRGAAVQFAIAVEHDSGDRLLLLSRWHECRPPYEGLTLDPVGGSVA